MPIDERKLEVADFLQIPVKYRAARLAGRIDFITESYNRGEIDAHTAMNRIQNSRDAYNQSMDGGAENEAS